MEVTVRSMPPRERVLSNPLRGPQGTPHGLQATGWDVTSESIGFRTQTVSALRSTGTP
jgi:hypothetical protein